MKTPKQKTVLAKPKPAKLSLETENVQLRARVKELEAKVYSLRDNP